MNELRWYDEGARGVFATHGLADFDALLALEAGTLVTSARTRRLRRVELAGQGFYLKVQDLRGARLPPRKLPSYALRGSPVAREARSLELLAGLGLKTPALVAAGARRGALLPHAALLVTREVEGHVDLARWLEAGPGAAAAQAAAGAAEALVAQVHERGFVLLGAKYRNLLLPVAGTGNPRELVVLDQPDLRRSRSARLRAKDRALLARDRARYLGAGA